MADNEMNITDRVRNYLAKQDPLTAIHVRDLYQELKVNEDEKHKVRAALYYHAIGTSVSDRSSIFYAIRIPITCAGNGNLEKEIFLSLPGITREVILHDMNDGGTKQIIEQLQSKYGKETIDYWTRSAQYHSVGLIRHRMNKAKERDKNQCKLCIEVSKICPDGVVPTRTVSACHIISRHVAFWTALFDIHKETGNIFSDAAVELLRQKLLNNELHSHERFMITLCNQHNKILQESLRKVV